jgi:hypothetical protein
MRTSGRLFIELAAADDRNVSSYINRALRAHVEPIRRKPKPDKSRS